MKDARSLAPFSVIDLPPKTGGFTRVLGPGAILLGLSIGSGELILWPTVVAEYGPGMAWAPLLGVFLQYWVNQELGRYVLATGESVYTGFARLSRVFVYFFLFVSTAQHLLPAWALASGGALKALLVGTQGWGSITFWTWCTFFLVALSLFLARFVYRVVEVIMMSLTAIIVMGLVLCVALVADTVTWREVGQGVLNVGFIDPRVGKLHFFAALVFSGVGGTGNIFLNYYLRDKGEGMGARMGRIINPLRGEPETIPSTGFIFLPTEENLKRWKAWFTAFRLEQATTFWFTTSLSIMLFFVAAAATLYPVGLVPRGFEIAVTQAHILEGVLGVPGWYLFLLVAFATLFSTQLAIVDGMARTLSDIVFVNFKAAQRVSLSFWYILFVGLWILVGALLALFPVPPLVLFISNACFGGLAMAVYCPLTLIINHRFLPPGARPGYLSSLFLVMASVVYVFFIGLCIATLLKRA
ncbi:MAG: Nramp family divalent metal transporter [Candidatus Brocadiaceae bacterium]|nr:Nramp family divalent metal transporter [Candidatus Brocadiaceae bacterium]